MPNYVQKLVTEASFDATGKFIPEGHIGTFRDDTLNGKEPHIADVGDFEVAQVQIAPIAPTGPNPTIPQQIPTDAVQLPGGQYAQPGKQLVAEVTQPQEQRIEDRKLDDADAEARAVEELRKANENLKQIREQRAREMLDGGASPADAARATGANLNPDNAPNSQPASTQNDDDHLVDGPVAEITADLGSKTDEELQAIRAAEVDREKPRKGVLSAVDKELEARKS